MKYLPIILLLLTSRAFPDDAAIKVPPFGAEQAAAAEPISISGPDKVKPGDTVICTLAGTPAVDLSKPLVEQLQWLIGPDQMFVFVQMPGSPMVPLEVEGTIVFGASGATMRPRVSFPAGTPGEYRVIVDWNKGQNQLAEKVVVVEGGQPDPFPQPDPQPDPGPVPPLSQLYVTILEESSDRSNGLEGAKLAQHLEEVRSYLVGLPVSYQILDDDMPEAQAWLTLLPSPSRPVAVVSAPALNNRLIGVESFGTDAAATIQRLKALGVK